MEYGEDKKVMRFDREAALIILSLDLCLFRLVKKIDLRCYEGVENLNNGTYIHDIVEEGFISELT
jgi:hypothetical protein